MDKKMARLQLQVEKITGTNPRNAVVLKPQRGAPPAYEMIVPLNVIPEYRQGRKVSIQKPVNPVVKSGRTIVSYKDVKPRFED